MRIDVMGNSLKMLWKLPVIKHAIKNKILSQTQFVFNKIVKEHLLNQNKVFQVETFVSNLKELIFPFHGEIKVLYHQKGKPDIWYEIYENLKYKIKNTSKVEMLIDKQLALKLKPVNKFLTPPEGLNIKEAFAFKVGPNSYFIFVHDSDDAFVTQMFQNFFYQFLLLAQSFNVGAEKKYLQNQLQKLKDELLKSNDKIAEVEKNLKKRLHEIDQIFQVSNELFTIHDREGLINTSLLTMVGQLGCDRAFILLKDKKGNDFTEFYSKGFGVEQHNLELEDNHPIIEYFNNGGEILYYDELRFKNEATELMPFFKEASARMVAPIVVKEKILGIMVCGEKLFGGEYDLMDKRIFKVLSNTINLAFTNLQVYEKAVGEAFVDKNTGIPNKKYFAKRLQEEKSRVLRQNVTLGLLTITLQNPQILDQLNDNQINQLDRLIVQKLAPTVRTEDFLSYIEPATLALLMPDISEETIAIAIKRFQEALNQIPFTDYFPEQEITFVFKFAIYPDQEEEFNKMEELLTEQLVDHEQDDEGEDFISDFDFGL